MQNTPIIFSSYFLLLNQFESFPSLVTLSNVKYVQLAAPSINSNKIFLTHSKVSKANQLALKTIQDKSIGLWKSVVSIKTL